MKDLTLRVSVIECEDVVVGLAKAVGRLMVATEKAGNKARLLQKASRNTLANLLEHLSKRIEDRI